MITKEEIAALMEVVGDAVKGYVSEAISGISLEFHDRIRAIPAPVNGIDGKNGRDGIDGKDGRDAVDGKDGQNGKDGIDGKNGDPGQPGEKGADGIDGKSITIDALRPMVQSFLNSIPLPKDGNNGENGKDGSNGTDGKSVTVEDIRSVIESEQTKHLIELERRANDLIQRCIDRIEKPKDGTNGKDGADGLGFDDMEVVHDGERAFTITLIRGDKKKDFTFKVPSVIERGVYRDGIAYEKGDGVTAGGNYWIALKDTSLRPGDNNTDWRLAVRKGRDFSGQKAANLR